MPAQNMYDNSDRDFQKFSISYVTLLLHTKDTKVKDHVCSWRITHYNMIFELACENHVNKNIHLHICDK